MKYMKENFDNNITTELKNNSFTTIYKFDLNTGNGTMILYHVLPGIDLCYNEFNAEDCNQLNTSTNYKNYIIINHCYKGRFETFFKGKYIFLSEGDLIFSSGATEYSHNFTLGFYKGLQIIINIDKAQKSIDKVIGENIIDLNKLGETIKNNDSFAIIRSSKDVEHVISELYNVEENIKRAYYKLKVIELLLFLKNNEIKSLNDEFPNLKESNVEKIKEIRTYLIDHYSENITLNDLSKKFKISTTSIKNYFKLMYGKPLFKWHREYRLNQAATYLENSDMKISEISLSIGYKDPSKFTKAFKNYYNMTPLKYKRYHKN